MTGLSFRGLLDMCVALGHRVNAPIGMSRSVRGSWNFFFGKNHLLPWDGLMMKHFICELLQGLRDFCPTRLLKR